MHLKTSENACPLCNRDLGIIFDEHHLIPKEEGGTFGPTVFIHKVCHRKIHSVLTNRELAESYHTIEDLLNHPDIAKFVKWVSRKDSNYFDYSITSKTRKW